MIDRGHDPVEKRVFFTDIKRVFFYHKKILIRIAALFAVVGFFYRASQSPTYPIESSFFERNDSKSTRTESAIESILMGVSESKSRREAAVMLKSHRVLQMLIEELGLAAEVRASNWIVQKAWSGLSEAVACELGFSLPKPDSFHLRNVSVTNGDKAYYQMVFSDRNNFQVFDTKKTCLAKGVVGQPLSFRNVTLTVDKVPKKLKVNAKYDLNINFLIETIQNYKDRISLSPHKENSSLLLLKFDERDPEEGTLILNRLMEIYREYLIKDNEQFAQAQVEYLLRRQGQLIANLEEDLKAEKKHLIKNIRDNGFVGFESEVAQMAEPITQCMSELEEIDLELKWLEYPENISTFQFLSGSQGKEIADLKDRINQLQRDRDSLDLALSLRHKDTFESPLQNEVYNQSFFKWSQDLNAIRNQKKLAEDFLAQFETEKSLSELSQQADLNLMPWSSLEEKDELFQSQDFKDYVQKMIHSFSLKERHLQKMDWYAPSIPSEIEGIDLETATELHMRYNTELDEIAVKSHHYQRILEQISDPKFELTSLGTVLSDPISQQMISQAGSTILQMKDFSNRSSKEMTRLKDELSLQRRFLSQHVKEMIGLKALQSDLIKKKVESLQYVTLQCIDRQLSAINQQILERKKAYGEHLKLKKEMMKKRLEQLKMKMEDAPKRWYSEVLLDIKKNVSMMMIQSMTQLVESKTIARQLLQVNSKPLDRAISLKKPNRQWLGLYTILFAFIGSGTSFSFLLLRELFRGLPASEESLKSARRHVSGYISFSCDGPKVEYITDVDLETLRQIILFSGKHRHQVISLIGGKGPNYSHTLCSLFAKRGYKVLLMECIFREPWTKGNVSGVLQNLEDLRSFRPIRMENSYDYVPSGGTTRFGVEKISSEKFFKLLEKAKKNYDKVILFTRAQLDFAEAKEYMTISDRIVLTLGKEKMDDLDSYIHWDSMSTEEKLSFVMFNNQAGLL